MKILISHNLYGSRSRGGAEKVVSDQVARLRASGHEVIVLTTRPPGQAPDPESGVITLPSHYHSLSGWPAPVRLLWQIANLFSFRHKRRLLSLLQNEKPELVITHNLMGLGFSWPRLLRRLKIRHEHWLHDVQLIHPSGLMLVGREERASSLFARIYQYYTRRSFGSPERIISPSAWLLDEHRRRGFFPHSNIEIRPLYPLNFPPARVRRPAHKFLFIGQVEEHKGILLLLDAFRRLPGPDLRLVIIGDGKLLDRIRKEAAVDKRISCLGRREAATVKQALAQADCLVVPSLCYENSPAVIYEARQSGCPVLAAAIGGIPEIIGPDDRLFQAGEADSLFQRLSSLT